MIRESLPVKALLRGSHLLGVPRLTATLAGRRLRILMYHGVTARPAVRAGGAPGAHPVAGSVVNHYGYNLPLPTFAAQIDYLVARCHPVSLDDVLAGRLSSRRTNVLLTFDDGYENNFVNAFPLLRERGVRYTRMKVDAGADYVVTQMFFDNRHYFQYVDMCRAAGIDVPIIPGLKILATAKQVTTLPRNFHCEIPSELADAVERDPKHALDIGVEWAQRQTRELIERGAPSIHFYVMQSSKAVTRVIEGLGL